MINRLLGLVLLLSGCIPGVAAAHDSSVATLRFIHLDNAKWVFELKTPLYGLDQSLRQYLGEKTGQPAELLAGSREYKERLVEFVKAGFDVTATGSIQGQIAGKPVTVHPTLGAGRLKLGNHLSVLIFEIQDMPYEVKQLDLRLAYMSDNPGQHNIVRLIEGERSERYILDSDNGFEARVGSFFQSRKIEAEAHRTTVLDENRVSSR